MNPSEAKLLIRYALSRMSPDNGHHEFEALCRHFVRETGICANLLPATGPVAGGGDQGRDFESFRGERDGRKLVFACTLTAADKLPGKIKSDVRKIIAGSPVDMVYALCGSDLRADKRAALIDWASDEYRLPLEIIDGNALAERLAEDKLRWICQRYLSVPGARPVTGLPRKARNLVGRADELARAQRMLAAPTEHRPLLVVTGPPGVGKTEFAIALAESVAGQFPGGRFLVEVPPGPADIVGLLSDVIDAGARPNETRQQQLTRLRSVLAGRRTLIVLDNVAAEDSLREVLGIDDGFAVLCTSRSRLTGLAVDGVDLVELEPLGRDDAARLAIRKAPRLSAEESQYLAEVCGGLPLAVLIAAAQISSRPKLGVRDYLDRMADPDRGMAELSAGQRSMAAIIEYSYQCLDPNQVALVQALGLLPNTTVTVDVIAGAIADEGEELDVLNIDRTVRLLDGLFELNLVEQLDSVAYRLHDVLYRFARMKAAGATKGWRDRVQANGCMVYDARLRCAAGAVGFVDPAATIVAEGTEIGLAMMETTRTGALAMVELAGQAELWEHVVILANSLTEVLRYLGHWDDVRRVCRCLEAAANRTGNPQWMAAVLCSMATAESHRGDSASAIELYRRSVAMAGAAGDELTEGSSRHAYGQFLLGLGRVSEATAAIRQNLPLWRALRDKEKLSDSLATLGVVHLVSGRLRSAEHYLRNARNLASSAGLAHLLLTVDVKLAAVLAQNRRSAEARELRLGVLRGARATGSRDLEACALTDLAASDVTVDGCEPIESAKAALRIFREIGDVRGQTKALRLIGGLAQDAERLEEALTALAECVELAVRIGDAEEAARGIANFALIHAEFGLHEKADQMFRRGLEIAEATGNELLLADVQYKQALLFAATGRIDQATAVLRRNVRILARHRRSADLAATQSILDDMVAQPVSGCSGRSDRENGQDD